MVVVNGAEYAQLLALLNQCAELNADVRPRMEHGYFTVTTPPPWNISAKKAGQEVQEQIKEWAEQYPNVVCYYERIERRESFIMFLRRTDEPEDPYYTLEIEPDGTVRQKRTLFDRQYEDIEQATEFLLKWQKVIAARLTGRDLKLAERSRELRKEEFIQMQKDRVIIHTGHLAGRLLADVLLADLLENTEVIQPQALPPAA